MQSALLLPSLCAACGPTALEGSLGVIVDLKYDHVRAAQNAGQVAVSFLRTQGAGEDVVLQVSARLDGIDSPSNRPIDLAERLADGTQRGSLGRNVLNDPRTTFPTIDRGRLLFTGALNRGQQVSGSFNVTFALGTDPAAGRTVFGDFKASVP